MTTTLTSPASLSSAAAGAAAATTAYGSSGASSTGTSSTGTSSTGTSSTGTATAVGNAALSQLGSNFNDFLNLLMTQLKNQDPTTPMDSNQFTTELVQFTGVQQQVNTNSSLNSLISLQQTSQVLQSSSLVGHQATVSSNEITLQNGTGEVKFSATAGNNVAVAVVNAAGLPIKDATLTAQGGTNTWQWDGTDNNGARVADGAYRVAVETQPAGGGAATALPFSVVGTTTGISSNGTTTNLALGDLSVPLSAVQSVGVN